MKVYLIPSTGYLRLCDVIGNKDRLGIIPIGRTTWFEGVKSGIYPRSYKLSERTVGWKVEEILELVSKISNNPNA